MSVFSTNQVDELIIGNAVATETTVDAFESSASDKEIKILSATGGAPASGEAFKVYQKTGGVAPLNYEFSDIVKADKVEKVVLATFQEEVQKSVRVTGFDGNVVADTTYSEEIRLYNDGGSLSPENFVTISGYYVTGSNVDNVTAAQVRDGIISSLEGNLKRRGDSEFVITAPDATETDILITGKFQKAVPGKIVGSQIEFEVTSKQFNNTAVLHENLGLLETTVVTRNNPGRGTGKYIVNREYFLSGFKYDVTRQYGFPVNFDTPTYASAATNYDCIHIQYFEDRQSPTVEKQKKVLTIAIDNEAPAAVNATLADLRTVLGTEKVPADIPVA